MQGTKFTVTVQIEVLSMDVVPTQLEKLIRLLDNEHQNGYLINADGDSMYWYTEAKGVTI